MQRRKSTKYKYVSKFKEKINLNLQVLENLFNTSHRMYKELFLLRKKDVGLYDS